MKKRIIIFSILCIIFASLFVFDIGAKDVPDLSKVRSVYVYNLENDRVLHAKNEDERIVPASTVKIMTGILAVEHYSGRFGEAVTVSNKSLGNYQGKNIGLKNDELVTVENLLYAVIVRGANDAANVLGYEIAGSHDAFLKMMNDKAKELGMNDTLYTNTGGYYDSSMYTTASDTLLLAKYAYANEIYMEICSTEKYVIPSTNKISQDRYLHNSNYLIATNEQKKYKNTAAKGMNAGSTNEGGHVVVSATSRNGMTNLFVVMGGSIDEENIYSYTAVNELIDWSYENFQYVKIVDTSEMVCEAKVNLSSNVDYVVLSPEKEFEYYLPVTVDPQKDITRKVVLHQDEFTAPLDAGFVAGTMTLIYDGQEIGTVDLITKNNVDRNGFLYFLARIKTFTKSRTFMTAVMIAVGLIVLYILISIHRKIQKNRYKYRYRR